MLASMQLYVVRIQNLQTPATPPLFSLLSLPPPNFSLYFTLSSCTPEGQDRRKQGLDLFQDQLPLLPQGQEGLVFFSFVPPFSFPRTSAPSASKAIKVACTR